MKYFRWLIFFLISINAYGINFELKPAEDDIDGVRYFKLTIINNQKNKDIDIALEGNANEARIREYLTVTCPWGKVEGVRIEMTSSDADGVMVVYGFYYFDSDLNNVFSKLYTTFNRTEFINPVSIPRSVCERKWGGVKKDSRTGKDYVQNNEVIEQGVFAVKNVPGVYIKYVMSNGLKLIRESEKGETIIDVYKDKWGVSAKAVTVFFINMDSGMNVVNLISWSRNSNVTCYKAYSYLYDFEGVLSENKIFNADSNMEGCDNFNKPFKFINAKDLKSYINEKYMDNH